MSAFVGAKVVLLREPEVEAGQVTLKVERGESGFVHKIASSEDGTQLAAVAFQYGMMWVKCDDLEIVPI